VGVQIRADDDATARWIRALDHGPTRRAIAAERRLLQVVEGGCQVPVGALTRETDDALSLRARVCSLDGTRVVGGTRTGPVDDPVALGEALGEALLAEGAGAILDEIRGSVRP
jgi:hydroxymethylbilane synthase